jgi:hypothetical protein
LDTAPNGLDGTVSSDYNGDNSHGKGLHSIMEMKDSKKAKEIADGRIQIIAPASEAG